MLSICCTCPMIEILKGGLPQPPTEVAERRHMTGRGTSSPNSVLNCQWWPVTSHYQANESWNWDKSSLDHSVVEYRTQFPPPSPEGSTRHQSPRRRGSSWFQHSRALERTCSGWIFCGHANLKFPARINYWSIYTILIVMGLERVPVGA